MTPPYVTSSFAPARNPTARRSTAYASKKDKNAESSAHASNARTESQKRMKTISERKSNVAGSVTLHTNLTNNRKTTSRIKSIRILSSLSKRRLPNKDASMRPWSLNQSTSITWAPEPLSI